MRAAHLPILVLLTGAMFSLAAASSAADDEWPMPAWTKATPRDVGLDERQLAHARDYALTGNGSGYITRGGKLVMAWGDPTKRYDLKSTTKSFGATALGLAILDGKMALEDKARRHHPTFGTPPPSNLDTGWLDRITILHLATQTAGFEKPGGYEKLIFEPGTKWHYSDGGPNWLAECITLAYRQDVDQLMFDRVFTPLGITRRDLVWRTNSYRPKEIDGIPRREFGSGISANVDAMARIGLLYLRGGVWQGKRILPEDFVKQAGTVHPSVRGLPVVDPKNYGQASNHYGLLWWNNADGSLDDVPRDAYWTWGLYDSLIVVIPSLDIVVARAGDSWKRTDSADHYAVLQPFLGKIAAAARATPLGQAPEGASSPRRAIPSIAARRDDNRWSEGLRLGRRGSERSAVIAYPTSAGASPLARAGDNAKPPYPPSEWITGIQWAPVESIVRRARGSDNWPLTWGDDDRLYTAYGDGRGFEPFIDVKLSMGLARISGSADNFTGENLRAPTLEAFGDGSKGKKASGMLMVHGILYLWARNAGNAQLAWSSDHGRTWSWCDWKLSESFGAPTFLNFGPNYDGARDDYVYIYSHDHDSAYHPSDRMVLARVPARRLRERTSYEFYAGSDSDGRPRWSADVRRRAAVFTHPGRCYRSGISYNAPLRRYLWCQILPGSDPRFAGGFGIYDAPEPWGPWTTVFYTEHWDVGPGESASIPTKWISHDGRAFHLVFSGDDHFSVRRATVQTAASTKAR